MDETTQILLDPFNAILQEIEKELSQLDSWGDRREAQGAEIALARIAQFLVNHREAIRCAPGPNNLIQIKEKVDKGILVARKASIDLELDKVITALAQTFAFTHERFIWIMVAIHMWSGQTPEQIVEQLRRYKDVIDNGSHDKLFGMIQNSNLH